MKAFSAGAGTQVPVGLLGLAMNTMRVRGVMARAMASRSWPSGMADPGGFAACHHPGRAGGLDGDRIHRERVLRVDGFEAGLQEGFGQQHQQIVGAIAERDLRDVDAEFRREPGS